MKQRQHIPSNIKTLIFERAFSLTSEIVGELATIQTKMTALAQQFGILQRISEFLNVLLIF